LRFPAPPAAAPSLVGRLARVVVTRARRSALGGRLLDIEPAAASIAA
jgi:hypothetical protein